MIVPAGASLAPLCVKCGKLAEVHVKKTFRRRDWRPSTGTIGSAALGLAVAALFRVLAFQTAVSINIPLCRIHRSKQVRYIWIGAGLIAIGLASSPFSYKAISGRSALALLTCGATLVVTLAGLLLLFLGVHILSLTELNDQYAAYTGFGIEYVQKIPSDTEIFTQKRR